MEQRACTAYLDRCLLPSAQRAPSGHPALVAQAPGAQLLHDGRHHETRGISDRRATPHCTAPKGPQFLFFPLSRHRPARTSSSCACAPPSPSTRKASCSATRRTIRALRALCSPPPPPLRVLHSRAFFRPARAQLWPTKYEKRKCATHYLLYSFTQGLFANILTPSKRRSTESSCYSVRVLWPRNVVASFVFPSPLINTSLSRVSLNLTTNEAQCQPFPASKKEHELRINFKSFNPVIDTQETVTPSVVPVSRVLAQLRKLDSSDFQTEQIYELAHLKCAK